MQCSVAVVRLSSLPLVGGGGSPAFSAVVGGGGRWRSSGCALRAHKQIICVISVFRRPFVLWVVSSTACTLTAVYIAFMVLYQSFISCWWYPYHTQ